MKRTSSLLSYLLLCSSLCVAEGFNGDFKQLKADMNSHSFKERSAAHAQIQKWASENLSDVEGLLDQLFVTNMETNNPEVRSRCYTLMEEIVLKRKALLGHGFLGIRSDSRIVMVNGKNSPTAMVTDVFPNTPAAKAGLKPADHIYGLDNYMFNSSSKPGQEQLSEYIKSKAPSETITVHILRNGQLIEKKAALASLAKRMDEQNNLNNQLQQLPQPKVVPQPGIIPLPMPKGRLKVLPQQGGNNKGAAPADPNERLKEMQKMQKQMQEQLQQQLKKLGQNGQLKLEFNFQGGQLVPQQPQKKLQEKAPAKELKKQDTKVAPPSDKAAEKKPADKKAAEEAPAKKKAEPAKRPAVVPQVLLNGQRLQIQPGGGPQVFQFGAGGVVQRGGWGTQDLETTKKEADRKHFERWYELKKQAYLKKKNGI